MAKKPPEKVFRIGSVSASVFVNEVNGDGPSRQVRNVSLQCSYMDQGQRKFGSYFGLADLLVAKQVLQMAADYVAGHEAEVKSA